MCRFDTILHEWSHAIAFTGSKDHGPEWGIAYAEAYSLIVDVEPDLGSGTPVPRK